MKVFKPLKKLQPGDRVAVLSPSFAAPGMFPEVYELGLLRLRDTFGLVPVEYPTTRKLGATAAERAAQGRGRDRFPDDALGRGGGGRRTFCRAPFRSPRTRFAGLPAMAAGPGG